MSERSLEKSSIVEYLPTELRWDVLKEFEVIGNQMVLVSIQYRAILKCEYNCKVYLFYSLDPKDKLDNYLVDKITNFEKMTVEMILEGLWSEYTWAE